MQAIITKYLPTTNTKPARYKATAARGSKFTSIHSGKMLGSFSDGEVDHITAAKELISKFIAEDEKSAGKKGVSKWTMNFSTGVLPNGDYVHVQNQPTQVEKLFGI